MTSKNHKIKLETFKDKSTLVKLLAEEDLSVIYQKVPTASFNVKTREVTLPIWKDKSEDVMDMMSLTSVFKSVNSLNGTCAVPILNSSTVSFPETQSPCNDITYEDGFPASFFSNIVKLA